MFFVEKQEKISLNYPQYPLLSGALSHTWYGTFLICTGWIMKMFANTDITGVMFSVDR